MNTWRELLTAEMSLFRETWDDVVSNTLSPEEMDEEFDTGYGGVEGCPFTLWTKTRVYFPACYDGAEWVASVARNPNGSWTYHVGGG